MIKVLYIQASEVVAWYVFHFIKDHRQKRNHWLSESIENLSYVLLNFWKEEWVWRLKGIHILLWA